MPELPEVETIRRTLAPHVLGARIAHVVVRERRLRRPIAPDFAQQLGGAQVIDLERRGKYLLFRLDGGRVLLVHLGMTGSLSLGPPDGAPAAHDHVVITFADRPLRLVYNDPRRFGLLRVGSAAELTELAALGRDPFTAPPTPAEWRALVRGRRAPIKSLLMDQRVLGGLGNIYVNELLFRAGIRPRRRAGGLRRAELERLAVALAEVLADAIALGGSSISDYRDAAGRPGSFQMRHAVYDRAGEPCRLCATPITRLVLAGRSTFYCRRCQR